jgi:peptidoglycan/xylan/chitin deacetylase (PgdA/CDA1 family)
MKGATLGRMARHAAMRTRERTIAAASRRVAGGAILLYHRVTTLGTDPQLLAASPEHFRSQMSIVRDHYEPVTLGELVRAVRNRTVRNRMVTVTFDDGYADNLHEAAPILEELGVPATVYIATSYTGDGREFWWDELERILLADSAPSRELALRGRGVVKTWPCETPDERTAAYDALHPWIRAWTPEEIRDVLLQLRAWGGEPEEGSPRETHRTLTCDEVQRLDRSPVIEIGAHTREHPSLGAQPLPSQRDEIRGSKTDLEEWLGRPVTTFSYPFGNPGRDYSRETQRLAAETGFDHAVANFPRLANRFAGLFELPRLLVRDWDGDYFEGWLAEQFHA